MQRTLGQAQARSAAAAAAAPGRAVPGTPPSSLTDVLTPLRALPWWAWALILLHMLYRILKVGPIWGAQSGSGRLQGVRRDLLLAPLRVLALPQVWRVPMPWAPSSLGGDGPPPVVPQWGGEQRGEMLHGEEL